MNSQNIIEEQIEKLIDKYDVLVKSNRLMGYNEEMTKKDFILPLFRALGWDVENGEEVTAEETISRKRVDYGFRIDGIPKFFLEAKALKEDLGNSKFVEQAINYAWHKGCSWAVLTDFEEVKVFNAEWKSQDPNRNLFFSIKYSEFLSKFDQLYLLSKTSFEKDSINEEAEKWGKKVKKAPVDKQLLGDLTKFREVLSKNIIKNNCEKKITTEELDESVQRIIDRLIFLRTLEDRNLEPPMLKELVRDDARQALYKRLSLLFRGIDLDYNSKLFAHHLCEELVIDEEILKKVILGLFRSNDGSVHYDFGAIDADVLGNIYEQYLGHILKKTNKGAKLSEGKAHRKEQGIYYTPTYIVDYIVRNTLGKVIDEKKIDLKSVRILDPSCGSGSFLMKAFDYLILMNKKLDINFNQTKLDFNTSDVIYGKKVEILKENIFGIDLDQRAVEIAQLNLLLKTAEKQHRLPILQDSIKVGNSLIDSEEVSGDKAFVWKEEFKNIVEGGGFDIIIGNPPWGAIVSKDEKTFFKKSYKSTKREIETQLLFIERGIQFLRKGGLLGFIVPNTWLYLKSTEAIRNIILKECKIIEIVELTKDVFKDVKGVIPLIIILKKEKDLKKNHKVQVLSLINKQGHTKELLENSKREKIFQKRFEEFENKAFNISLRENEIGLIKKIKKDSVPLDTLAKVNYGIKTGDNKKYLSDHKKGETWVPCLKSKDVSRYLIDWQTLYLEYTSNLAGYRKERIAVPKIVIQYIRNLSLENRLICGLDDKGTFYPLNNYSYITSNNPDTLRYLLGILNSKLMNFYFSKTYIDYNIKPLYLSKLPIIKSKGDRALIRLVAERVKMANKNLKLKLVDEKTKINELLNRLDKKIDETVYKMYGLTKSEMDVIETAFDQKK